MNKLINFLKRTRNSRKKNLKCEYIWLDGSDEPMLRAKTKIMYDVAISENPKPSDLPLWSFDGSSTEQATGEDSDRILSPVFVCRNPFEDDNSLLIFCQVMLPSGRPHESNIRQYLEINAKRFEGEEPWFGIEQEYFIMKENKPLGFIQRSSTKKKKQGDYYCGIGADRAFGRKLATYHREMCMKAGLAIGGVNAEVAPSQWEYQIGPLSPLEFADQMWVSRYILYRCAEDMDLDNRSAPTFFDYFRFIS